MNNNLSKKSNNNSSANSNNFMLGIANKEEPEKEDFLTRDVELINFKAIKRVCHTCCEPEDCLEAMFESKTIKLPYCPRRI